MTFTQILNFPLLEKIGKKLTSKWWTHSTKPSFRAGLTGGIQFACKLENIFNV